TLDGLGTVGGGSHADDEHALLSWIPRRVELTAALVASLLDSPVPRPDGAAPPEGAGPPIGGCGWPRAGGSSGRGVPAGGGRARAPRQAVIQGFDRPTNAASTTSADDMFVASRSRA